jgi:drug/metabolite transporter (DMT)-like permease
VGLGVSFTGVLLVIIRGDFSLAASPLGLPFLFMAVAVGVTYTTALRGISARYNPIAIVTYQFILGVFWFLPLFLAMDLGHFLRATPTTDVLVSLGLLALLPTSLAFILFAYSVRELGAARASMFGNSLPVFTAVFAWLLLNEALTVRMTVGIGIVILGLFVSQVRKKTDGGPPKRRK